MHHINTTSEYTYKLAYNTILTICSIAGCRIVRCVHTNLCWFMFYILVIIAFFNQSSVLARAMHVLDVDAYG